MINRQSQAFLSDLGSIVHAVVKIILGFILYDLTTTSTIIRKSDSNVCDYCTYTTHTATIP